MGRTVEYIMKENKILDYFQLHKNTCLKQTFSLLNNDEKNFSTYLLADSRTVRNNSQNKCGPLIGNIGWTLFSQNSYLYRMKINYNKLPRQITLSPNFKLFKKWLHSYTFNPDVTLPVRIDNHRFNHISNIDRNNITRCIGD